MARLSLARKPVLALPKTSADRAPLRGSFFGCDFAPSLGEKTLNKIKLKGFEQTEYIDCTPTWSGVMPLLLEGVKQDIPEAREELYRLARLVDRFIAKDKESDNA